MRHRRGAARASILAALSLILSLAPLGCSGGSAPAASPVLLVGIDGFEWDVLLPLLRQDQLPHIAGLMERGSYGLLSTTRPTFSPIIWTSMATGKLPAKHGIRGFVRGPKRSAERRLFNSRDRKVKAFWNILSDFDRSVAVIGWWVTHPVEPVNGVMVAQVNTLDQTDRKAGRAILKGGLHEGVEGQVFPDARAESILDLHDEVARTLPERTADIFGESARSMSVLTERLWENTQWAFRSDSSYAEIATELAAESFDVLAVYLGGADVAGHRFWRHMAPAEFAAPPSASEIEEFGGLIPDYYRFIDRSIGRIAERLPEGATTIIVSDHGMHAINRKKTFEPDNIPKDLNSGHHHDAPPGVLIAAGPGIRESGRGPGVRALDRSDLREIGSVLDVTPTLLALARLPVGEDMDGEVMTGILAPAFRDPATVASHNSAEWLAARADPNATELEVDEKRLEQLRALGYIN